MKAPLARHRLAEAELREIADFARERMPEGVLFAFVTFTQGKGGYAGYISTGQRPDMIAALRECADTLEAKMDVPPGAPIPTDRKPGQ